MAEKWRFYWTRSCSLGHHTLFACFVCIVSDFNPPWRESSSLQEHRFEQRHIIQTIQQKDKTAAWRRWRRRFFERREEEFGELTMEAGWVPTNWRSVCAAQIIWKMEMRPCFVYDEHFVQQWIRICLAP